MRGDDGEANDKHDEEAAVAGEACEGPVVQVCSFKFDGFSSECIFERVPGSNYIGQLRRRGLGRGKDELSPRKVPAATIAKPIQRPQTTPQSRATSS